VFQRVEKIPAGLCRDFSQPPRFDCGGAALR
jgi:hypothetical protein